MNTGTASKTLVAALMQAAAYSHPVQSIQLVETHISWVILTGDYAYKIKKPVNLGFLDFSSLEQRRICCEEEVRLNRRLAPGLYLGVVAVTGTPRQPLLDGPGAVIEYAVRMVQFPQAAQFDRMLERGALTARHIDAVARLVADFHGRAAVAGPAVAFGDPGQVFQPVEENFLTDPHGYRARQCRAGATRGAGTLEPACVRAAACRHRATQGRRFRAGMSRRHAPAQPGLG